MVRVRIAPSPTGNAHFGFARTALFNYLFAKKHKGSFIVRIEDTDKERSKGEFEVSILSDLKWLGLSWDEGPDVDADGVYGPYRQSERGHIYKKYLEQLSAQRRIYKCYCTKEQLDAERQEQVFAKLPPRYSGKCRDLTDGQRSAFEKEGRASTIRFLLQPQTIVIDDLIRGKVQFDTSLMDDFIIAKNFDTPLYNFAVVIDDSLMDITHVIRGEEHISNTPKQIQLSSALGLHIPQFGHLPLILDSDRKKMSKRENKTALFEYRNDGYLPEALINFMALLGWNPGGERELYTLEELEEIFDLAHVNKSGSIFDLQKLDWFNGHYIRHSSLEQITHEAIPYFISSGLISMVGTDRYKTNANEGISFDTLKNIVEIERQRIKKMSEIALNAHFYFVDELQYDSELLQWKGMAVDELKQQLAFAYECLENINEDSWTIHEIEHTLKDKIKASGRQNGEVLWPLRVALSGLKASPGPFEIASIIHKAKTIKRIDQALAKITS